MPTLTPTEGSAPPSPGTRRRSSGGDSTTESMLELVLPDGLRVRLYGDAQRAVLNHILNQLSPR